MLINHNNSKFVPDFALMAEASYYCHLTNGVSAPDPTKCSAKTRELYKTFLEGKQLLIASCHGSRAVNFELHPLSIGLNKILPYLNYVHDQEPY
jgi:hypothetical protein